MKCSLLTALTLLLPVCSLQGADAAGSAAAALESAERLAWLRNWSAAQPYYAEAERHFEAAGDRRNAAFARISRIRGELHRLALIETSQRLATELEDPLMESDLRLRLRCLVVKGDVDLDFDSSLAQRDWAEAKAVAETLGDAAWVNRANGELAIVSFLGGDHMSAALTIAASLNKAKQLGDVGSVIRYQTLIGSGLVQWKQYDKALKYFDEALAIAKSVPEIQHPLLVYSGKIEALIGMGKKDEARKLLAESLAAAQAKGAVGYEGELHLRYGLLEAKTGAPARAIEAFKKAAELADSIDSPRIAAQSTLALAQTLQSNGQLAAADAAITRSIQYSRKAGDRIKLPETLAEAARINVALRRHAVADQYFEEATDIANGVINSVANLSGKTSFILSIDRLYVDHFRYHANRKDVSGAFTVAEAVHGRAVADALQRNAATKRNTARITPAEKRIAQLQLALMRSRSRVERHRLLSSLERAEEEAYPALVANLRAPATQSRPVALQKLQKSLDVDELVLEFLVSEPKSYCVQITHSQVRIAEVPGAKELQRQINDHLAAIERKSDLTETGRALFQSLAPDGFGTARNVVVIADGPLHRLPFDTLVGADGKMVLTSHTVWYAPSATVLNLLANRTRGAGDRLPMLAVSAGSDGVAQTVGTVRRSMFDLDGANLPPLPAANSEARSVAEIFGAASTVLTGTSATEAAVKSQPLDRFRILHFATHGLIAPDKPERAGLLFSPDADSSEDGLWQVREIERTRLHAQLVTLSACRAGSGKVMGTAGVTSLVTPFLAAGAGSVLANLWDADDTFTSSLMSSFYTRLAKGLPSAEALRQAKLDLQARYGPEAPPYLWAGFILTGLNRQILP